MGDEVADDVEVLGEKDGRVGEVGEEEGVGRRRRRGQRWKVGEVESKVGAARGGRGRSRVLRCGLHFGGVVVVVVAVGEVVEEEESSWE